MIATLGRLLAVTALLVAACGGGPPPPPDQMAEQVARLDRVIPIVEELRVNDYENSAWCRNLGYARGAFGDLQQTACLRENSAQFDALALADHARLAEAIQATGVAIDRIQTATYDADGLVTAWFALSGSSITENWHLLFDPGNVEPKQDIAGRQTFTRLDDAWWFVLTPDD